MKTKTPTKTIADVRVAVVQLECHPNFTLGALNFLKEPFIDDKPILRQLSVAGVDVRDLQMLCHNKYLLWHCARLVAVIDWLNKLGEAEWPHIVVFPEGAVPRVFLKCLRKRLKFQCLVFAGTHALDDSLEAMEEYQQMGISPEALKAARGAASSRVSDASVGGELCEGCVGCPGGQGCRHGEYNRQRERVSGGKPCEGLRHAGGGARGKCGVPWQEEAIGVCQAFTEPASEVCMLAV